MTPTAPAPTLSRLVCGMLALATGCVTAPPPAAPPAPASRLAESRVGAYWRVRGEGRVPATRLATIRRALQICDAGLARAFPGARPGALQVIAYPDRLAFVRGLRRELGLSERHARYFLHSASPRPVRGKLLVPPDQGACNICHELVHHVMQSVVPMERLLQAKWLDEGSASLLAARIIEPGAIRGQLGWLRTRRRYVPFYLMRTEEGWGELHRVPELRSLAYLQAMDLVQHLLRLHGEGALARILESARVRPLDAAFFDVTGRGEEAFFAAWLEQTRGSLEATRLRDPAAARGAWLPAGDPAEVGLDPEAMQALVREAALTRSDTLLVIKDGRLVVERSFFDERGPIETMSVTKSFVSLAVGLLLARGKIASLDTPLHTWLPELARDGRAAVTLRHVLTHTSGLEHAQAAGKLSSHADRTRYARKRPLVEPPGLRFSYSNEATQLLSEVVRQAAGEPLDRYLARELFAPLGIPEPRWERDPAGNVQAYHGLALSGRDLARVGLLLLAGGQHGGRQLLPSAWIEQSTAAGLPAFPQHGLLWWRRHRGAVWLQPLARLARLEREGLTAARRLRPLCGRSFARAEAYWLEAGARLRPPGREELQRWIATGRDAPVVQVPDSFIGYNANGWQGQYLAVYPAWRLVVVRQRRPISFTEEENRRFGMWRFFELVERLVPRQTSAAGAGTVTPARRQSPAGRSALR